MRQLDGSELIDEIGSLRAVVAELRAENAELRRKGRVLLAQQSALRAQNQAIRTASADGGRALGWRLNAAA